MDNIDNMDNSQLQLVTNEQALRLKKMKFDWKCIMVYNDDRMHKSYCSNHNKWDDTDLASAPTVARALKWFRDCVKIVNHVSYANGYYGAYKQCGDSVETWGETDVSESYEAAESALLDELLTFIEKQPET